MSIDTNKPLFNLYSTFIQPSAAASFSRAAAANGRAAPREMMLFIGT
jgi:hypothetical protein